MEQTVKGGRNGSSPRQTKAAPRASCVETAQVHSGLSFLRTFIREPFKTGAFWPSSKALARVVVDSCDIKPGEMIVELGPGTGAFTKPILKRLNGRGRLLAVEIDSANAAILRRTLPRCEVIHDSAANLPSHMNGRRADCIVSGLAWGNMLPRTQDTILEAMLKSLAPDGQFVAFAYVHALWFPTTLAFRRRLLEYFKSVETTPIIWRNLPPAFVIRCNQA